MERKRRRLSPKEHPGGRTNISPRKKHAARARFQQTTADSNRRHQPGEILPSQVYGLRQLYGQELSQPKHRTRTAASKRIPTRNRTSGVLNSHTRPHAAPAPVKQTAKISCDLSCCLRGGLSENCSDHYLFRLDICSTSEPLPQAIAAKPLSRASGSLDSDQYTDVQQSAPI